MPGQRWPQIKDHRWEYLRQGFFFKKRNLETHAAPWGGKTTHVLHSFYLLEMQLKNVPAEDMYRPSVRDNVVLTTTRSLFARRRVIVWAREKGNLYSEVNAVFRDCAQTHKLNTYILLLSTTAKHSLHNKPPYIPFFFIYIRFTCKLTAISYACVNA